MGGLLLSEKRLGFQNLFRRVLSGFAGGFDVGVRVLEEFFVLSITPCLDGLARIPLSAIATSEADYLFHFHM